MKLLDVPVRMSVRDVGEVAPPFEGRNNIGGLDFKPDKNGPVVGRLEIFTTRNFMGWELISDNGLRVRFDITPLLSEASKHAFGLKPESKVSLGVSAAELVNGALAGVHIIGKKN